MITHKSGLVNTKYRNLLGFVTTHKNGVSVLFIYDRLDELVKATGKKKNYLSQKMGFTGRYLNDAKKQNTDIKGEPLRILAEELGTTPEYLTGETDKKESPAPFGAELNADRIQSMVSDMSTEDLAALLSMAANEMAKRNGK